MHHQSFPEHDGTGVHLHAGPASFLPVHMATESVSRTHLRWWWEGPLNKGRACSVLSLRGCVLESVVWMGTMIYGTVCVAKHTEILTV